MDNKKKREASMPDNKKNHILNYYNSNRNNLKNLTKKLNQFEELLIGTRKYKNRIRQKQNAS